MGHRAEAGMHDLVVHSENEDVFKMAHHQRAKLRFGLAVDVARFAGRRGPSLRLERGHADNYRTMRLERVDDTVHDHVLLAPRNMLKHIERKDTVMATGQRLLFDIADDGFE